MSTFKWIFFDIFDVIFRIRSFKSIKGIDEKSLSGWSKMNFGSTISVARWYISGLQKDHFQFPAFLFIPAASAASRSFSNRRRAKESPRQMAICSREAKRRKTIRKSAHTKLAFFPNDDLHMLWKLNRILGPHSAPARLGNLAGKKLKKKKKFSNKQLEKRSFESEMRPAMMPTLNGRNGRNFPP